MRGKEFATERDIMKAIAVMAVVWQGVLNFLANGNNNLLEKTEIVILYNLVKFSAPVFIFATCYDLSRIKDGIYNEHISHKFKELIIPYGIWTTIYMLIMGSYNTVGQYMEGYIFGTAAPHLWYTVMMFQFQLLIIFIWKIYKEFKNNEKLIKIALMSVTIFYFIWMAIYNQFIFNKLDNYLKFLDRAFISYSIYCVLGIVAAVYLDRWKNLLFKMRYIILALLSISFAYINYEVLTKDVMSISLHNIIYLKPSMLVYNIAIILFLYLIASLLLKQDRRILKGFKFISTYAFRAYLANYFCLIMITKIFKNQLESLSLNIKLLALFLGTTITAFGLVYLIEVISTIIKGFINAKKGEVNEQQSRVF